MMGCLGLFFRLLIEAFMLRIVQWVVNRLTGDHLLRLLKAFLAIFGIRI